MDGQQPAAGLCEFLYGSPLSLGVGAGPQVRRSL